VKSVASDFPTEVSLERGLAGVVEHFQKRRAERGPARDPQLDALVDRILGDRGLA
jgi:hypothetical protein